MATYYHSHMPSMSLCLPWMFCLVVLASTSAIRGLRIMPAESAAGRYMSSGVVQRSVSPAISAMSSPMMEMMNDQGSLDPQQDTAGAPAGVQGGAGAGHWMGLGVLSNMQQFFDSLRNNLDSLEDLPAEEKDLLLGRAVTTVTNKHSSTAAELEAARRRNEHSRASRPTATAAYLHALRSHRRPSHKFRNFATQVEVTEPRENNYFL